MTAKKSMSIIKFDGLYKLHKRSRLKQAWFTMLCIRKNVFNGAFGKKLFNIPNQDLIQEFI